MVVHTRVCLDYYYYKIICFLCVFDRNEIPIHHAFLLNHRANAYHAAQPLGVVYVTFYAPTA